MSKNRKTIIQKIKLSEQQQAEIHSIKKGMTLPKTKVIKNSTRKYAYEYTTKAKPLSEKHQKDKLREIYGDLCCICGK
jgi:intein-encoded DNA endonuclease-like protein